MPRRAGLRALFVALALSACNGGDDGRELSWEYGFTGGADPARAAFVRARILEPGCGGTVLYEEQIRTGIPPAGMVPPELPAGTYGFSIEARDESCTVFAAGCAEARVPEQRRVTVPVSPTAESAACLPVDCSAGECPGPDASVCMPAPESCNDADDDCDAIADEDFDLTADVRNCGACGTACALPNATTECAGALCTGAIIACDDGFEDCDGTASTGCEVDLGALTDCGACGVTCGPFTNAAAICDAGSCRMGACDAGFADCDGDAATGCEMDIRTLTDCGACGTACALPNATATCATETCEIDSCSANFDDCDGNPANGCEVDVTNTNDHCGACRNRCPGSRRCCSGVCENTCMGGVCCAT